MEIIKRKWHPIPPYWPRSREEHGTSKSFFSASSVYACVNGSFSLDENAINACACACVARQNVKRVKESQRLSMFQLLMHINVSACIEQCKSISRGFNLHQVNSVCEPETSSILVGRLQNLFLNLRKPFIFLGRQTL